MLLWLAFGPAAPHATIGQAGYMAALMHTVCVMADVRHGGASGNTSTHAVVSLLAGEAVFATQGPWPAVYGFTEAWKRKTVPRTLLYRLCCCSTKLCRPCMPC